MTNKKISRRRMLKGLGLVAAGAAAAACQPKTVVIKETVEVQVEKEKLVTQVVTQVVEVEKEVTKIVAGTPVVEKVVETKVVEKVVTATPPPAPVDYTPKLDKVEVMGGTPFPPPTPREDNTYLQELEKRLGLQIDFFFVPWSDWPQKLTATLAAGRLPDILAVTGYDATLVAALQAGAFVKVADLGIPDETRGLPGLSLFPRESWEQSSLNGEIYGVPTALRRVVQGSSFLRKDWLEKFGMSLPSTIDEFKAYAEACVTQDPDGNGKADTIAYSIGSGRYGWNFATRAFGVPNGWGIQADGTLVSADVSPQIKAAVGYIRELNEMDAFNPDFPTIISRDTWTEFVAGLSGGYQHNDESGPCLYGQQLRDNVPGADVVFLAPLLEAPGYEAGVPLGRLWARINLISGKYKNDPETAWECIKVMDFWFDPENFDFINFGFKDVHHEIGDDGYPKQTAKGKEDIQWVRGWGPKGGLLDPEKFVPYVTSDWIPTIKEVRAMMDPLAIENPAMGLYVDFEGDNPSGDVRNYATQTYEQIIRGERSLDEWDAFVEEWYERGGQRVTDLTTAVYQEYRG